MATSIYHARVSNETRQAWRCAGSAEVRLRAWLRAMRDDQRHASVCVDAARNTSRNDDRLLGLDRNPLVFDDDLVQNSAQGLETKVEMGTHIGKRIIERTD